MTAGFVTTQAAPLPRFVAAWVVLLVVASGLLLVAAEGNVALAFVPVVASAAAFAVWRTPMRPLMLGLFAIGIVLEGPSDRAAAGLWRSPLYWPGAVLYDNLNNVVNVRALRFSGLDVLVVVFCVLVAIRMLTGHRTDARRREPTANITKLAFTVAFLTVVWLELWGLARGGDFKNSLWQVRQLLWLPVLGGLFSYALRGTEDVARVARIVVVAACIKVALGMYFLLAIARPQGLDPAYVTTHGDSVLFTVAIAACVARWLHRPTRANLLLNLTVTPWILLGIVINNRRLAFVGLFAILAAMYSMLTGRVKRALQVGALAALPVLALYIAIGSRHPHGIFAPAGSIVSVISQKDASSETRDIENFNLLVTLKSGPLLGSGFGHEYQEVSKAYDISKAFAQYRFIAHNSVLWLWSIGGVVGFTALWLMLATGVFLAMRTYRRARGWEDRTAASIVLAAIIAYMIQAWGDMGTQSWVGTFLLAVSLALIGKLAVATGAWPSSDRVRIA